MLAILASHGVDYTEVLKEVQDLGYAKADPSADVEDHDVRAKICILAKLAFGVTVHPPRRALQGDFQIAKQSILYAKAQEWDSPLCIDVSPFMIPLAACDVRGPGT